nr:homeobox protein CDX-2 [Pogona vitticeps]
MYVSYLLDKEGGPSMYPGSVRHAGGINLAAAAQNFVGAPQYPDYGAYHVPAGIGLENAQSPGSPWPGGYGAPPLRDDWNVIQRPCVSAGVSFLASSSYSHPLKRDLSRWGARRSHTLLSFVKSEEADFRLACSRVYAQLVGGEGREAVRTEKELATGQLNTLRLEKDKADEGLKTRTKDKYRVVYTDHQRLELEKEFHYSRYITIRRKAELAATLGLSERQVKIWFQNRRAKERKINKKKMQQSQPGGVHSGSEPMSPVSSMQPGTTGTGPNGGVLGTTGLAPPPTAQ